MFIIVQNKNRITKKYYYKKTFKYDNTDNKKEKGKYKFRRKYEHNK